MACGFCEDAEGSVFLAAGWGDYSLGDFVLDGDVHFVADDVAGGAGDEVYYQGRADAVGEVCDEEEPAFVCGHCFGEGGDDLCV